MTYPQTKRGQTGQQPRMASNQTIAKGSEMVAKTNMGILPQKSSAQGAEIGIVGLI